MTLRGLAIPFALLAVATLTGCPEPPKPEPPTIIVTVGTVVSCWDGEVDVLQEDDQIKHLSLRGGINVSCAVFANGGVWQLNTRKYLAGNGLTYEALDWVKRLRQ
jgi:hypothetical protein